MIVIILLILALAVAQLGLALSFVSAASAKRLTKWWLITLSIVLTPIFFTAALVGIVKADLIGGWPVISLIYFGAALFLLGSVGEAYGATHNIALRVVGWGLMLAPMIVSLSLSVFRPLPVFLIFFLHPRWDRRKQMGRFAEDVRVEQLVTR